MTYNHPALIVEGHEFPDPESCIAPDGEFPPFRLFSPAAQDYLRAEFPDRATAETACAALLPFWTEQA